MSVRKKVINEAGGDFSILRSPSPYRIGRAPAPLFNADEQMAQNYLLRAAEEANTFNQKLQLAGRLDKLDPLIRDLYKQYALIYHFIDEQLNDPTYTKETKEQMIDFLKKFDKIGTVIMSEIIPSLDEMHP